MPSRRLTTALVVTGATAVAAATGIALMSDAPADARPALQTLDVRLSADATTLGTAVLHPGVTRIDEHDLGPGQHDVALARLHEGVTPQQLLDAFSTDYASAYALVDLYGELNDVPAGQSGSYTVTLDPGSYLVLDTGSTGTVDANFLTGLYATLEVRGHSTGSAGAPHADVRVEAGDGGYRMPATFPREGTVRFTDGGRQQHEFEVARLHDGATVDDLLTAMQSGTQWPADPQPGFGPVSPGVTAWFDVDLDPGTYVVYDFIPDPATGLPHVAEGMVDTFTVR